MAEQRAIVTSHLNSSSSPPPLRRSYSVAIAHQYQYFKIGDESHIRLLTLLPGQPQDTIRITLTSVDATEKDDPSFPLYECLSYTWGSSTKDRVEIYADNKIITVTKNLAVALIHLRHNELPRIMWIGVFLSLSYVALMLAERVS